MPTQCRPRQFSFTSSLESPSYVCDSCCKKRYALGWTALQVPTFPSNEWMASISSLLLGIQIALAPPAHYDDQFILLPSSMDDIVKPCPSLFGSANTHSFREGDTGMSEQTLHPVLILSRRIPSIFTSSIVRSSLNSSAPSDSFMVVTGGILVERITSCRVSKRWYRSRTLPKLCFNFKTTKILSNSLDQYQVRL